MQGKVFRMICVILAILAFLIVVRYINNQPGQLTAKPVIYLYPPTEQKVSVKLEFDGKFTFTYPEYNNGWNVIAKPDGTLLNVSDQKEYSYLFWEGIATDQTWDLSKGFVVRGEDTKDFLQVKLSDIGLTPTEYNEFIVYWLPKIQNNKYNLISFVTDEYANKAKLKIQPEPDSVLRVFMVVKPLDQYREIERQEFSPFKRQGFTVVEWGGTEISD